MDNREIIENKKKELVETIKSLTDTLRTKFDKEEEKKAQRNQEILNLKEELGGLITDFKKIININDVENEQQDSL